MTELILEKISNIMSKKRTECIEIIGKINEEGILIYTLKNNIEFNSDLDYNVSLSNFESPSSFPNITKKNNKFYYSVLNQDKIITLETGSYSIENYNKAIKQELIDKDAINITLNESTGHTFITLKENCSIDFTKNDTFAKELGFTKNEKIIKSSISDSTANILKITKIFIFCSIIRGSIYKGTHSTLLFSFPNNKRYGSVISISPNPLQYKTLVCKLFNEIVFTFKDQNENPVNFLGNEISLSLIISQI